LYCVEYDGTVGQKKAANNKNNSATSQSDSKLDSIAGDETIVDNAEQVYSQNNTNSSDTIDQSIIDDGINKTQSQIDGQTVVLNSIHFAFDRYDLTSKMRDIATANSTKIDSVISSYGNLKIKLEGNCDEWGTDEYNYALGLKRAKTVKDALITDGIDENRIMMVSFGESNPVCTEKNVECWKMNRRVDYRLLP
jgi:peptidoglycan-associated lipoprotein